MVQACACGASWLSRGGTSVCGLTMVNILSGGRKEEEDGTQGLSRAQAAQEPATRPQEAMKANGFSSWKRRVWFWWNKRKALVAVQTGSVLLCFEWIKAAQWDDL